MSLTKFRISLLLAGVVSAAAIDPYPDTVRDEGGRAILALGPQQELAASNLLGSGLDYFPDEGTSLLASPAGTIRLLVGTGSGWLMTGNGNFGNVAWTAVSKVLEPDSASEFDNGYAGFSGAWTDTTGRVWGVYHAEDHVGLPDIPGTQIPGFYATVALAVSNDSGKTWTKEGPLVRSHAAKDTASGAKTDQGAGEPGLVASPDGKWLYLDYTDHSPPDNLDTRICLARIPIQAGIPQPSLCAKWDGSGFTRSCLGGRDTSVLLADSVLGGPLRGIVLEGHPSWIPYLGKYAMAFGVFPWVGLGDTSLIGTWIAFSTDMIHWIDFARLLHDNSIPVPGKSLSWEASILPDDSSASRAWLVYGTTPRWPDSSGGQGTHAVRRHMAWSSTSTSSLVPRTTPSASARPPGTRNRSGPERSVDGRVLEGRSDEWKIRLPGGEGPEGNASRPTGIDDPP